MSNLPIVEITLTTWNPRTCTGLHRVRIQCMLSTVYQPLDGIYGPHRRHLRCQSSTLLTRVACILCMRILTGTHGGTCGISATFTSKQHSSVTFENRSRKWNIGLETAKQTLQVTTQCGKRTAVHPLHRRYCVDHLHLNRQRLNGDWFANTSFSNVISIQGNTCAQVFTKGLFTTICPLDSKAKVVQASTEFAEQCWHSQLPCLMEPPKLLDRGLTL
jgi:hypothetical protein